MSCVDIISDGIGITVWAYKIPELECETSKETIPFIDLAYPSEIPDVKTAIEFAKAKLGDFPIKSAG